MKKGAYFISGETLLWINKILLTVVIMGAVFFVVNSAIAREININEAMADLTIRKLYYSSECFALQDVVVEPGEIDISKFTEERLRNCTGLKYPIKVELENNEKIISNIKNYKDAFNLCQIGNKQKQCLFKSQQYILVSNNGKVSYDILKAEVIVQ